MHIVQVRGAGEIRLLEFGKLQTDALQAHCEAQGLR